MAYSQVKGRKPFERASKIAHSEILNNPVVQEFVGGCTVPSVPTDGDLTKFVHTVPPGDGRVRAIIAIDGGSQEVSVRREFPSATFSFMTLGPVFLWLKDFEEVGQQTFIGPEDMARFRNIERYNLVLPLKNIQAPQVEGFALGVRKTIHRFFSETYPELETALRWLLFREWLPQNQRLSWTIPKCPNESCEAEGIALASGCPSEQVCPDCGGPVYLSDTLRLYERIDEELGAGGITSYLLTGLEQLVLVRLIKTVWELKRSLLSEILFVKDGPLAFFGTTAPLHKPMRELMMFLGGQGENGPAINLVGLEKSGPFVEHAIAIAPKLKPGQLFLPDNDYIFTYIQPGNPQTQKFGRNTYYGAKVIVKGEGQETYVATVPTGDYCPNPQLANLFNCGEVLQVMSQLPCSMYDNALVPIVLANRLVSLANVPSSNILEKFSRQQIQG